MRKVISFSLSDNLISSINSIPKNERSKQIESILSANLLTPIKPEPDPVNLLLNRILSAIQELSKSLHFLPNINTISPISSDISPILPDSSSISSNLSKSLTKQEGVSKSNTYTYIPRKK
jgi:hypothetical protein